MKKKTAKKKDEELEKTKQYKIKGKKKNSNKKEKVDLKSISKQERKAYKKQKRKKSKVRKFFLGFFLILFLLIVIALGIFAGLFFGDTWAIDEKYLTINTANSIVYDREGNVICELNGNENRKIISMEDMSPYLPQAFIAIEDKRFYEHGGVDIKRTAAAVVSFVFNNGSSSFGGSTITQQLIKNITEEKEDSGFAGIERKVKEMSRAIKIEKILSKDQILEKYLNLIYLGGGSKNIAGVEVASEYYFNKSAKDLDIAECAFLAGINHSPNAYDPYNENVDNSEKIQKRTLTVLYEMKDQGKIDEAQYEEACNKVREGLTFEKGNVTSNTELSYTASAALDQIAKQIAEEQELDYQYARDMLYGSGYRIYTTEDPAIQSRLEEEYLKDKYIRDSKETEGAHTQSAMVIIDHTTGQVVACVGGLGEDSNALGLNRAKQARQPGSSIKPIAAIAPALEAGVVTAATVYDDSPTTFPGYSPRNSTGYQGLCTVRRAIGVSANIFEVKVLSDLGVGNSIEFMQKAGITTVTKENDSNLAMVLGGMHTGVSPLEMAGAYAMVANDGVYITPTFYTKLEDSNGVVILEPEQEETRVMSEGNAYILKSILTETVVGAGGTARSCSISRMSVGAKTGTTNNKYDRWLCGFTPYYTAATWFGYDYNESVNMSGNPAATIWAAVMRDIHKDLESKSFERPSNIVSAKICMDSGCVATEECTRTYTEVFVKGTVPDECEGHKKLTICKTSGKIANEFCTDTEEKTYLTKPEKEREAGNKWKTSEGDKYDIPTETCDVHKKPEENKNNVVNNTTATNTIGKNNTTNSSNATGNTNTVNGGGTTSEELVEVPNFVGQTIDAAKATISKLGLTYIEGETVTNSKPKGTVISQGTKAGTKVKKGSKISLTVSSGPAEETPTNTTEQE